MKILVISQYYPPEPGATSNRLSAFVKSMAARGHSVTVICEFPNYPTGRLRREDRWRLFRVERLENHRIIRTAVCTFRHKNNLKRLLFYISFAFSSLIAALIIPRHDIIFASSPPIFHAFTAMLAARIKGAKFVVDIRDVWPDTAKEFEAVENKRLLKYGSVMERMIYRRAKWIFTTTAGFKELIDLRGGDNKSSICYNGSFEELVCWKGDRGEFRKKLGWAGKIVIVYAGLIGIGQNLIDLLPEIQKIRRENLSFLFIGNGPQKDGLQQKIDEMRLTNILLMGMMPMRELLPYLEAADISLVILRESEFFRRVIPSKFFDSMAIGKPLLSNVDGELRALMEKYDTGKYFSLRETGSFGKALSRIVDNPVNFEEMRKNGRLLIKNQFLRSALTNSAVELMEKI